MTPEPRGWRWEGLAARQVVEALDLAPHLEGGYFREVYRSVDEVSTEAGRRPLATSILYLLTTGEPNRFHRLRSDELWFYHAGARAEMVLLQSQRLALDKRQQSTGVRKRAEPEADAEPRTKPRPASATLASRTESLEIGPEHPVVLVPAQCWMAARVISGCVGIDHMGADPAAPHREEHLSPLAGVAPGSGAAADETGAGAGAVASATTTDPGLERRWTLLSCVVTPGFDYDDLELADREALLRDFPEARELILALT